jgi:GTP pyrophosphokinase
MNRLERALAVALDAYEGQEDKAGAAYIRHPLRVMHAMETDDERIVALLHDVVEDSPYTLADIEAEFGKEIREAVDALTHRKQQDESYQEFVSRCEANSLARRVKLADIEDNMDLTRLDELTEDILERQEKYHKAHQRLTEASSEWLR